LLALLLLLAKQASVPMTNTFYCYSSLPPHRAVVVIHQHQLLH
jgi:hypothetical protein